MESDGEEMVPGDTEREKIGIRLDDSTELALDIDVFLRKNVYAYTWKEITCPKKMNDLAEELLAGQTADIRWWLKLAGGNRELKDKAKALMDRVRAYEKEYGIPEPVDSKKSVREQLADAKKQSRKGEEDKQNRKREIEK